MVLLVFFVKQKTAYEMRISDWSSDVCSSDLGRYERGHEPRVGAVLAFSASRSMPVGHVAMVSKVVSEREVLLTHANWSYRGGIERNVRAIDVSPNNDWTDVRVWYGPIGDLGLRPNPAKGRSEEHPSELQSLMRT